MEVTVFVEQLDEQTYRAETAQLEIPEVAVPHPWVPFAGIWKDHPDLDTVLEHIAEERRRRDAAESEA